MFDLKTKAMIGIASSLLIAAITLIIVVACLYFKISKALRTAKSSDSASYIQPCKVTQDEMIWAKPIVAESCPTLQCCGACNIYSHAGPLPPCFCDSREGL